MTLTRNSLSCISSSALQFRSVTITLGSSRCASSISFLCCVNISCVVILRSVSKFRLHIFFQVFFYVQLVITALAPIRRDVGDVLAAVRPSGVVTLRAEQDQKFLTVSCAAHTLVDHAHEFKFPTLAFVSRVVFRVGHSAGTFLLIPLKFRQPQFFADLVIADAQLLNLFVCHMYFFSGFKIHAVDNTVRMNVFAVNVRADQHLAALKISRQLTSCLVCCARIDIRALREALHHVIEHHAAVLVVQQLRTQELVERRFRLTADAADELLSIPERFIYL